MTRSTRQSSGSGVGAILLIAIVGLLVFSLVSYIWFPFLIWGEQRDSGEEIARETQDADKARQDYEEFRDLYHEIEAQRGEVENAYEEEEQFHETYGDAPSEWSREAEIRHGRIHERITGSQNQLEQLAADYNAKSDKAHESVWKCHLPYKVDERFAVEGPPGSGPADQPQDKYVDEANPDAEPPAPEECEALPEKVET